MTRLKTSRARREDHLSVFRIALRSGGTLKVEMPGVPMSRAQLAEVAKELHALAEVVRKADDVKRT